MKRPKSLLILLVVLIAAFATAAGCFTITVPSKTPPSSNTPQQASPATSSTMPGDLPTITLFSASPETITTGQSTTISWDVTDATAVEIKPMAGSVGPSGSQQISPAKTTTYTLTATNSAGNAMKTITVTVTAAVATPDLVVTEVTVPGLIIFYKVKNLGGASTGSRSYLYVNDAKVATDYIEPLASGEERLESFSNYTAQTMSFQGVKETLARAPMTVRVCVDAENNINELNEDNNCLTKVMGATFIYDFVDNAHLAVWRSGAGELKWPMVEGDTKGAAFFSHVPLEDGGTHANTLATYPQQTQLGSIQGTYGKIYTPTSYMQQTQLEEITVPPGTRFTAKVGFAKGAEATQGATVYFGIIDPSGSQVTLKKLDIYYDGMLDDINVDLNQLADKEVFFFLRVESKGNGATDQVVWVEPKVSSST